MKLKLLNIFMVLSTGNFINFCSAGENGRKVFNQNLSLSISLESCKFFDA